ncbi:PhaM family polyhydroxyalkanoate granule multifunctional regulatory protein [Comamonas composti]|uniref:PhaM family polyhydroxyalkanoate granule multifunctional regulatory protein n=1 Tax=Comamonas composti TaxID=408558 RepID=UPI000412B503|nr:PhaM family polyhydroxyalkanoate granule multifunctional regulatory protein [Comamonas composti]
MSQAFGFGNFIPGFDFLQGLAQAAGAAKPSSAIPQWVAPTVSIEEVDKRIAELKAVQFWLEQNSKALAATIQALEVQRMTLSTLKGMNVSLGELAQSFQFPGAAPASGAGVKPGWPMQDAREDKAQGRAAPAQASEAGEDRAAPQAEARSEGSAQATAAAAEAQAAAMGQAVQWWGALTQQFQQIAAKAMAEPLAPEALAAAQRATGAAGDLAKSAVERMSAQAQQQGKAFAEQLKSAAAKTDKGAGAASGSNARPAPKAAASLGAATKPAARKAASKKAAAKPAARSAPRAK